jgi:hypothetical protein
MAARPRCPPTTMPRLATHRPSSASSPCSTARSAMPPQGKCWRDCRATGARTVKSNQAGRWGATEPEESRPLRATAPHETPHQAALPAKLLERTLVGPDCHSSLFALQQGEGPNFLRGLAGPLSSPSQSNTGVSSTGRRNSPAKHLAWFHPTERLSRAVIELPGDGVEVSGTV